MSSLLAYVVSLDRNQLLIHALVTVVALFGVKKLFGAGKRKEQDRIEWNRPPKHILFLKERTVSFVLLEHC